MWTARRSQGLRKGVVPIFEPGLEEVVHRNMGKRLCFTTDLGKAVQQSDFIFIAVSTPLGKDGEADITNVKAVARGIAKTINRYKIIINKSTVPIGMGDVVTQIIIKHGPKDVAFDVVSNPEFLREGSAVQDLLRPDRVVIGATRRLAAQKVAEIYKPLNSPILITDLKSAEMIKYASNAFLATKIDSSTRSPTFATGWGRTSGRWRRGWLTIRASAGNSSTPDWASGEAVSRRMFRPWSRSARRTRLPSAFCPRSWK